jgi:hypothetical protein
VPEDDTTRAEFGRGFWRRHIQGTQSANPTGAHRDFGIDYRSVRALDCECSLSLLLGKRLFPSLAARVCFPSWKECFVKRHSDLVPHGGRSSCGRARWVLSVIAKPINKHYLRTESEEVYYLPLPRQCRPKHGRTEILLGDLCISMLTRRHFAC